VAGASFAAATCTVSVGNVSFGAYTGTLRTSSSTLTVTCTISAALVEDVDFTATLSTGQGTYAQRLLRNTSVPADTLPYNLYLGAVPGVLNTNVWGNGTSGTIVASGSMQLIIIFAPTRTANFTVAGAIAPVAALPSAGLYSDLVSALVTYN
jgi:spore coat protein U-like protein